ncbi:Alpha/Beta hydrolase protein [Pseudomassariella vexata]|uniref:Alpha/Beta hydrolase protein n=1 Tax=Pseudomassariella vexata TaxID=1141098 RepID=A0A1Y2DPX2_9PEZI|nr:Alpha/Beta hydrolase protein [Pseudomassariella vexata]ORY61343.1 Alpha/Beta hydrolase protein [Pseudomassariella vexata]
MFNLQLLASALLIFAAARRASAVDSLVDLGYTQLQGTPEEIGVTQWLGVRFAAAPVGDLRFAAPIDPPATTEVVQATEFQPICLPRAASDFTMQPNKRFTVDEDCLFVNIFAPTNATADSKLPVMYFIQGGGFQSLSNANFNASELAAFGNMIVVQTNYRVGPFGFLQSQEVINNGSLNNGLKDQIQGLKWLKTNIAAFGGNPEQMVAVGDSSGATSISLLMMALRNDTSLIKGAIMESVSVATIRILEQGQEQYACLVNASGCAESDDTLACMRALPASSLQTEECQFNPHIDGELIEEASVTAFAKGNFLKIPTIVGSCTDEGTKNVAKTTNTTEDALTFFNNQASQSLSNASLDLLAETYLNPDPPAPIFDDAGALWRPLANGMGDIRAHCVSAQLQNDIVAASSTTAPTYNYRYAVIDQEQEELGFGAYHTVELNGVFGPNNTDGAPPKSYFTTNAAIVPVTMAYWASFVATLDPNTLRLAGSPEWTPWTGNGDGQRERLRFQTNNTAMEQMNTTQALNCEMVKPMIVAIERPPSSSDPLVELSKPVTSNSTNAEPVAAEMVLTKCIIMQTEVGPGIRAGTNTENGFYG